MLRVQVDADGREGEIHSLKCDIKKLNAMVTALMAKSQAMASKKKNMT